MEWAWENRKKIPSKALVSRNIMKATGAFVDTSSSWKVPEMVPVSTSPGSSISSVATVRFQWNVLLTSTPSSQSGTPDAVAARESCSYPRQCQYPGPQGSSAPHGKRLAWHLLYNTALTQHPQGLLWTPTVNHQRLPEDGCHHGVSIKQNILEASGLQHSPTFPRWAPL